MATTIDSDLPVDGHVHYHSIFDLETFLASSVAHFSEVAARMGLRREEWHGALLFTETFADRAFAALAEGRKALPTGWSLEPRTEEISITLRDDAGKRMLIVSGQQAVTREKLEVLGIGISDRCRDGLPLSATIDWIREGGGYAVLPWGFGKWSFSRGRIIADLLKQCGPKRFAVGDNGGRLGIAPRPSLLRYAESLGYAVLPGTDPLPYRGQEKRVGSTGFVIGRWNAAEQPGRALVARLAEDKPRSCYLKLTGAFDFARLQLGIQLRKASSARTS